MSLRRFWVDLEILNTEPIVLDGDLAHHIRDVCRIQVDQEIELLSGDQKARRVKTTKVSKKELHFQLLSERELPELPRPHVHLFVSLPKLPKMDWILEKCVELGVKKVTPFLSDFSFLRKASEISASRVERWRKLVVGATQQCGRGDLMELGDVRMLEHHLKEFNRSNRVLGLFPFEGEAPMTVKERLRQIKVQELDEVWVFVGSEGGFSVGEVEQFRLVGLEPLTLGDQVLRVETACLALVSILKYELNG